MRHGGVGTFEDVEDGGDLGGLGAIFEGIAVPESEAEGAAVGEEGVRVEEAGEGGLNGLVVGGFSVEGAEEGWSEDFVVVKVEVVG